MSRRILLPLAGALALASTTVFSQEWPAYRGSSGDGAVRQAVFEAADEIGMRVAWRRSLGSGYSAVVVANGKAVTMFSDGAEDYLIALDQATGHEHWRTLMGPTYVGHDGSHTGPISTPLIAEGRVFALGPRGRLISASLEDGEVVWSMELSEELAAPKPHYGFASAPILVEGVLVVQVGAEAGTAIAGFDPATGEALWTVLEDTVQYQSPITFPVGDRRMVMAVGDKKLAAIDPRTGELAWEFEHEGSGTRGVQSSMPVVADAGRVFLAYKESSSRMIRIGHDQDSIAFEPLWENAAIRNSYNVAVYHEGHIYAFSSRFLTCVNAETGETAWKSRAPGDGFLTLVDGHLVVQTKEGSLHIAQASPEGYDEVASLEVFQGELSWSTPGFADGSLFARSLGEVARVDLVSGESSRMAHAESVDLSGSVFGALLAEVEAADDKRALITAFLDAQESFPIIEDDGLVHFVYHGEATDLALAGDMIGSRQEVPMRRVEGTDLFHRSMHLLPDARLSYVFIVDYEEKLDSRNPNQHLSTAYGHDMEMIFQPEGAIRMSLVAMPGWKEPTHIAEAPEERRGTLESHEVQSTALGSAVKLAVYLPAAYDAADAERRYPVAYVYGGTQAQQLGKMVNTLDNLTGDTVEPILVAFVDAPLPPFQMGKYGDILADDVVAFVDQNFRTRAERESRASVGVGFPGYGALFAGFTRGETFGKVGAISPTMLDSMRSPLEAVVPQADETPIQIYLDWAHYDLRNPHENWDTAVILEDFSGFLRERGYEPSGGAAPEGAGWIGHRSRTDDLLETLFPAE